MRFCMRGGGGMHVCVRACARMHGSTCIKVHANMCGGESMRTYVYVFVLCVCVECGCIVGLAMFVGR